MKYPKFLQKGDQILFVAPSLGATIEPYYTKTIKAKSYFMDQGYQVEMGPNVFSSNGVLSSTKEGCAKEINDGFNDSKTDFLISIGGGEMMCQILPFIDFELIKKCPKWFMGFSDNTNLTFTITTLCDVASIYGVNAGAFGETINSATTDAYKIITGQDLILNSYPRYQELSLKTEDNLFAEINLDSDSIKRYYPNKIFTFTGRLLGGCLDVLVTLCGTRFDQVKSFIEKYKEDGIVWFLEACDLNVLNIRRAFFQLDQAGWFKYVKGFIIGRPFSASEEMFGIDKYSACLDVIASYNVPIIFDADLGHKPLSQPFITGSLATVSRNGNDYQIIMKLE